MLPLWLALGGAGLGLAKSEFIDRPQAARQRKQEAEIARWSPWTGMGAQRVQEPNALGGMLQGGMTGAMLGQSIGAANRADQLASLQQQYLQNQNNLSAMQGASMGMPTGGMNAWNPQIALQMYGQQPMGPMGPVAY